MIPLVVNTPDPMLKIRVVAAKDYSTKTLKTLHKAGVLHVEQSEELKPVDREAIENERRQVSELLAAIEGVLTYVPKVKEVFLEEDVEVIYTKPFSETDSEVRKLTVKLGNMHQGIVKLEQEVANLEGLKKYLEPLGQQTDVSLKDLNFSGSYLFSRVLVLPSEVYEAACNKIKGLLFGSTVATIESETILHIIARVEDEGVIESVVKESGGRVLQIPNKDLALREFVETAGNKIHSLGEELIKLRGEIENQTGENLEKLVLFREALSAVNERLAVLEKACEARYVMLTEGWIPEAGAEDAISQVKEDVEHVFVDARKPAKTEEPPSKFRNPGALEPFQVIVNLFATPKYKEWDPTPIIAYSFAFFFGLMLGDVVYAAIIIAFARFGLRRFVDDPQAEGAKLFQRTLYISCGVALVIGVLTGNYFGDFYLFFGIENMALSQGIKNMLGNPMSFIVLSLIIGLVHVNIAHVLDFIKGIRARQKAVAIAKVGLFLLQISGIPWILHAILGVDIPLLTPQIYTILLYVVVVGIVLIVVSSVMQKGAFLGGIFWLFDITGLLGDVMSYCRLAGVGLATFYLASCFNLMASLLSNMVPAGPAGLANLIGGGLVFIIILFIGHAINLILSGICCFVHSLRLCFVEFLFKFYEGGGREYSPFRLRKRALVPVKARV